MFDAVGDEVIAAARGARGRHDAAQGQVVALRPATGEYDCFRRGSKHVGHLLTRGLHGPRSRIPRPVMGRGVAE